MPGGSKKTQFLQRCVADVTGQGKDLKGAFAICTAQSQKAGYSEPGSTKQTVKGAVREKFFKKQPDMGKKAGAYEKAVKAGRKSEDMAAVFAGGMRMRGLLRNLEEGRTIHVPVRELPDALRAALKTVGYGAKDVGVTPQEAVTPNAYAGEGQRGFVIIVNLETGKRETLGGDWGGGGMSIKPIDAASQDVRIPPNGAVIIGTEGHPRTMASIYVHPDVIAKLLPPTAAVTDREQMILRTIRSLTSAGRKEVFGDQRVQPAEVDALVARGLLARSKAGAVSITTAGKNVAEGQGDGMRSLLRQLGEAI